MQNSIEEVKVDKCIITDLPLTKVKRYGKCHSRIIHNLYKLCEKDIEKARGALKDLVYVKEYDNFYGSWHACSKGLSKAGHQNVDRVLLYEKYFKNRTICRLKGCNKTVPFEMVRLKACCTLHYNHETSLNYDSNNIKFMCLEDGNKFMSLNRLTRHIKFLNIFPKDYYDKHYKKSDDEGKCKWCGNTVKFVNVIKGYDNFCYNTNCNINWYNKHQNRAANCAGKISDTHLRGDILKSQKGYWIKRGCTDEEAYVKVRESQPTNSVESIMKRKNCSINDAISIRSEITDKWLKSFPKSNFSKISQKLFQEIYEKIKHKYSEIYFATLKNNMIVDDGKNHEFRVKTYRSSRKLDFYIKDINKCIEFDGTYWHGIVGKGNKSKELSRELEIIDSLGCDIFHVKEMDYCKSGDIIVKNCLNFLNKSNGENH